ncbi:oligosaccharide repeat unit polymerase, partial [Pseudoxanthomonas sp. SGD-10]
GYMFGSLLYSKNKLNANINLSNIYIPTRPLYYLAFTVFILFVITGGYNALAAEYSKESVSKSPIANYIFILFPAFLLSGIILEFYNLSNCLRPIHKPYMSFSKTGIIISFLTVFLILLTGSRTVPMQIILVLLGLYTLHFYSVSFPKFLIMAISGVSVLFLTVVLRGYSLGDSQFSLVDLVMDLVVNNRNSYVAIEYVHTNGVTFGKSMMGTLFAPIPFLQNLIIHVFGIDANQMGSSLIITEKTLGEVEDLGMGTNIIADLYMAFGFTGVLIFMPLLGFFISYILINARSNIYALGAYSVMLSYSIFMVRAEFFFPLRFLIWSLIIIYLSKQIYLILSKKA